MCAFGFKLAGLVPRLGRGFHFLYGPVVMHLYCTVLHYCFVPAGLADHCVLQAARLLQALGEAHMELL